MSLLRKAMLYGHTIKTLRPVQIRGLLKRKICKLRKHKKPKNHLSVYKVNNYRIEIPQLDEDERYLNRFDIEALLDHEIVLLHERHRLDKGWQEKKASHLWNFNLHYLEFTIPLAVRWKQTGNRKYKDKWIEFITLWLADGGESVDALEPYTISLRIVNMLIGLELVGQVGEGLRKKLTLSVYGQYQYLSKNTETGLLANHYFENLKALVIGSVVFGEWKDYRRYWPMFLQQLDEQILPDGIHFERSPMYHKLVLEGVLRVYQVLQGADRGLDAEKLVPVIKSMAGAASCLEAGFLTTPLFNDSGGNVSKNISALLKVCKEITKVPGCEKKLRTDLTDSGYYRFDNGKISVLFDCGEIGPSYMGGHGHNDCLSFELAVDGRKIFTNSGTGQYQGKLRCFFRSTSAHNTVMIDDYEQNELWGEHRAARRADGFKVYRRDDRLAGRFQSYTGEKYSRVLCWKSSRKLEITDRVECRGGHIARQYFHLIPGLKYVGEKNVVRVLDGDQTAAVVKIGRKSSYLIHTEGEITSYAPDFGKYEKKQVLEIRTPFRDTGRIRLEIEIYG